MKILFPEETLFHFCTSLLLVLLVKGVLDVPNNVNIALLETMAHRVKVHYNSYVKYKLPKLNLAVQLFRRIDVSHSRHTKVYSAQNLFFYEQFV